MFTPRHFLDLATRRAIASALKRQTDAGHFRQLARGMYDYPKRHPRLGMLAPTPDALAKALAGRDEVRLQPSGAYAANLLGLSDQVPAKVVFLTDGASRLVRIGRMTVQLRRTTPRNVAAAGRRGVSPVILEKDFWVCWLLRVLFEATFRDAIVFKGGTSLSKVFGVIDRFSQDIDLKFYF